MGDKPFMPAIGYTFLRGGVSQASVQPKRHASQAVQTERDGWVSRDRLAAMCDGIEQMRHHPRRIPAYEAGFHSHWRDRTDNCYSFLFRVAIAQKLMSHRDAQALMARIPMANPQGFRAVIFPDGHQRIPLTIEGERVRLGVGAIPRGQVVSLDGGAHVMVSTGRVRPDGQHEVYSFKGGQAATPVWGDAPERDDQAQIHILTIEDELENLLRDDQDVSDVYIAAGPSALTRAPDRPSKSRL